MVHVFQGQSAVEFLRVEDQMTALDRSVFLYALDPAVCPLALARNRSKNWLEFRERGVQVLQSVFFIQVCSFSGRLDLRKKYNKQTVPTVLAVVNHDCQVASKFAAILQPVSEDSCLPVLRSWARALLPPYPREKFSAPELAALETLISDCHSKYLEQNVVLNWVPAH